MNPCRNCGPVIAELALPMVAIMRHSNRESPLWPAPSAQPDAGQSWYFRWVSLGYVLTVVRSRHD